MHTFLDYIIDSQCSKRWTDSFVTISIDLKNIYTKIFIIFLEMNNPFIRDWKLECG